MKKLILATLVAVSFSAAAKLTLERKVEPVYIIASSGQQVDAITAMKASMNDQAVLKCEQVEATAKATGSISFKKKK